MTIEEMKARKAELGYTNEKIAALSGVPLGTVQKIFAGETKAPRYDTIQKLVKILEPISPRNAVYKELDYGIGSGMQQVREPITAYDPGSDIAYGTAPGTIYYDVSDPAHGTPSGTARNTGYNAPCGSSYRAFSGKLNRPQSDSAEMLRPPKKVIGIADGKYKMPPDELLFDDEISDSFEDI